jgi:hypothetical protein
VRCVVGGGGVVGKWCCCPRRQSPMGGKVNIISEKKYDYLCSTHFKLLSPIQGNSVNNCDFFKFIICFRSGHCDYSPCAPNNPFVLLLAVWIHETLYDAQVKRLWHTCAVRWIIHNFYIPKALCILWMNGRLFQKQARRTQDRLPHIMYDAVSSAATVYAAYMSLIGTLWTRSYIDTRCMFFWL